MIYLVSYLDVQAYRLQNDQLLKGIRVLICLETFAIGHIFSSPEQNAQVSFSHPFSSVVRRP